MMRRALAALLVLAVLALSIATIQHMHARAGSRCEVCAVARHLERAPARPVLLRPNTCAEPLAAITFRAPARARDVLAYSPKNSPPQAATA